MKNVYLKVLKGLQESFWRKRPELWLNKCILYQENAPLKIHSLAIHFIQ